MIECVCVYVHVCTCGDSVHDCVCGLCKTVLWGSCWLRRCGAERGSAVCLSVSTLPVAEGAGPGPGAVVKEHLSPSATVWLEWPSVCYQALKSYQTPNLTQQRLNNRSVTAEIHTPGFTFIHTHTSPIILSTTDTLWDGRTHTKICFSHVLTASHSEL